MLILYFTHNLEMKRIKWKTPKMNEGDQQGGQTEKKKSFLYMSTD